MDVVLSAPAFILSFLGFALSCWLALEVVGAFFHRREQNFEAPTQAVAVIVPAHNEAGILEQCLRSIIPQLKEQDRVIVVADNCTDSTSDIARANDAECIERENQKLRGKGFALQFGIDHLASDPPGTVVFVDADCVVNEGAIEKLASAAAQTQAPVQALYLMKAPSSPEADKAQSSAFAVAEFAWAFINKVRMRGLDRLFGVTRLTGSGIAMPWRVAAASSFGSSEIVEDLAMTVDFVKRGLSPRLIEGALVTSEFPISKEERIRQTARWEHGSRRLAKRNTIDNLASSLSGRNLKLFALTMDMLAPPMVLFFIYLFAIASFAGIAAITGITTPLIISVCAIVIAFAAVFAGWLGFGREIIGLRDVGGLVSFALAKIGVYKSTGRDSAKSWTPTRMDGGIDRPGDGSN